MTSSSEYHVYIFQKRVLFKKKKKNMKKTAPFVPTKQKKLKKGDDLT